MGKLRSVVVGIVVPLFCICVLGVAGYFIHYLVWGKEEKLPHALVKYTHTFTFTFTFRVFSRHLYPKRLTTTYIYLCRCSKDVHRTKCKY